MKIRTYILFWMTIIVSVVTISILIIGLSNIKQEYNYAFNAKAQDTSRQLGAAISKVFYGFSGQIESEMLDISRNASAESDLASLKDTTGADWAFVTVGTTNYIYPKVSAAKNLSAESRPWYISSLDKPDNLVGNEFYSQTLKASVVSLTISFERKGRLYVGGILLKEDHFFNLLLSEIGGTPFIITDGKETVYPKDTKFYIAPGKNALKLNGEDYMVYRTDYTKLLQNYGVRSSMGYNLELLIPSHTISSETDGSFYSLLTILLVVAIGEFLTMFFIAGRIKNSVEALAVLSQSFDLSNATAEVDEKLEEMAQSFTETEETYSRISELFQDVEAHVQELKATNEELESSYEDVEQLSSSLARETQELKDLSEASSLITLSKDNFEASEILLDKLLKIYDCDGIAIVDTTKNEFEIIDHKGKQFVVPDLIPFREDMIVGKTALISDENNFMVSPVIFESKLLAVVVMYFEHYKPSASEMESLKRFMAHFGSLLNTNQLLKELKDSYVYLATRFAEISEIYDYETGSHVHRVSEYSSFVARELGMSPSFVRDIRVYSMIHDLGKLKVPREILTKNGPLTGEEFEEMKKHTIYGEQLVGDAPFLTMARHITRAHHEKFDGSGYPDGLKEEEIPVEARIVSIADIYDALRSPRRYKRGFTHEETMEILLKGDGRVEPSHFDPEILRIFVKQHLEFSKIYESLIEE